MEDLASVYEGESVGKLGWFSDELTRNVGDGSLTSFWKDNWLEGGALWNVLIECLFY